MSSVPFSRDYFPPAPVLQVQVCVPDERPRHGTHTALIDTGADGTMAPLTLLEQVGVPVSYMVNLRTHIGDRVHRAAVYHVDLNLENDIRLPGIDVVSDDWGQQIILGRNVLNKLHLFLNGPDQFANVLDPMK